MGTWPRILTITWFIAKHCQVMKRWDYHFPGKNNHLQAEQTIPQFQTIAYCVHFDLKLNPYGKILIN